MRQNPAFWKKHLRKAAAKRAETNVSKYSKDELAIEMIVIGQKHRCSNPNSTAYERYGAKGIKFKFDSNEQAIRWIINNLGPRPSLKHSIDRIDNRGHYEPGNLRWATPQEQARNKGQYQRTVEGERLRRLAAIRTDYSETGLLRYIKRGWTDAKIIKMKKPAGGRPRKNA